MGTLIVIEKWAENLTEVTVNRWLKQEGDRVVEGDSLCEIITEKVTFEYEIEQAGVLRKIYCPAGSVVPVGYVIAFIGEPGEALPTDVGEGNARLIEDCRTAVELDLDLEGVVDELSRLRAVPVRATPAARRLARQQQVDLAQVTKWIGESRAVTEQDINKYLKQRAMDSPDD